MFIDAPEGVSDIALRRRTEALLSSALKHGTTDHLKPHPWQIDGDADLGVPPLEWKDGDTTGNMANMIEVSVANLAHHMPEILDARYDFESRTFRTGEGQPIPDGLFETWATSEGMRETGGGRRTLKRGILLNTLLREESGKRPGLLEQVLHQSRQLVEQGDLSETLYQRSEAQAPPDRSSVDAPASVGDRSVTSAFASGGTLNVSDAIRAFNGDVVFQAPTETPIDPAKVKVQLADLRKELNRNLPKKLLVVMDAAMQGHEMRSRQDNMKTAQDLNLQTSPSETKPVNWRQDRANKIKATQNAILADPDSTAQMKSDALRKIRLVNKMVAHAQKWAHAQK